MTTESTQALILLILILVAVRNVQAFSLKTTPLMSPSRMGSSRAATAAAATTSKAGGATSTFTTILDGPCWESLQDFLHRTSSSASASSVSRPKAGILTVVTGTLKEDDGKTTRVVGMPSSSSSSSSSSSTTSNEDESSSSSSSSAIVVLESGHTVVADSVARIPSNSQISDQAAATIFAHAVTHVHALCTVVENVGGAGGGSRNGANTGSGNFLNIPKKVVILGGHDDAINAAKAMAVLGSEVTLVSTNAKKVNIGNNRNKIQTLTPASGELELGFADMVGTFDALLDTIGNELPHPGDASFNTYKDDDDDDEEESLGINRRQGGRLGTGTSTVVRLLQKLHSCHTYVSTCSGAEQVIAREGLLFGPNKAKEHMQQLIIIAAAAATSRDSRRSSSRDAVAVVQSVPKIGSTVETLLEAGFVWGGGTSSNSGGGIGGLLNMNAKTGGGTSGPQARGWSMPAAWEATTWPRDSSGNVRFGLPVVQGRLSDDEDDDDDEDEGRMISKPPLTARRRQLDEEELDEEAQNDDPMDLPVMQVVGLKGLNRQILARDDQDVILFLSAPFCRTCRRLTTPYARMARANKRAEKKQKTKVPLVFAKADASGLEGKTLGRALSVEAVPAFVLFKNGKRYGSTLSVSKIPSEQLDRALEYLRDGRPWDNDAFRPQNTGRQTSLKER